MCDCDWKGIDDVDSGGICGARTCDGITVSEGINEDMNGGPTCDVDTGDEIVVMEGISEDVDNEKLVLWTLVMRLSTMVLTQKKLVI